MVILTKIMSIFGLEHVNTASFLFHNAKEAALSKKDEREHITRLETLQSTQGREEHRNAHRCTASCCDSSYCDSAAHSLESFFWSTVHYRQAFCQAAPYAWPVFSPAADERTSAETFSFS